MLSAVLRSAARPALASARLAARPPVVAKALSTSAVRRSGPAPPSLFGPGAKPGEVPSDEEQATGLERLQLLGELEGVDVFDTAPLDASRVGTPADPIKVFSLEPERVVGCSGSPAESHDVIWFNLEQKRQRRCPECGSVYALDFQGDPHAHAHH